MDILGLPQSCTHTQIEEEFNATLSQITGIKRGCGQLERGGEEDRLHFQFYVEFEHALLPKTASRRIQLQFPTTHTKVCDVNASTYCTKEDSRVYGPWYWPDKFVPREGQGERTDLSTAVDCLRSDGWDAVVLGHPTVFVKYPSGFEKLYATFARVKRTSRRRLSVYVLWGAPGLGKTTLAYTYDSDLYRLCLPSRGSHIWWDGYTGQDCVLLDDFYGQVPITMMLNILDGWPLRLSTKGSFTYADYTKVIVTSNVSPDEWYNCFLPTGERKIPEDVYAAFQRRLTKVINVTEENYSLLELFSQSHEPASVVSESVSSLME